MDKLRACALLLVGSLVFFTTSAIAAAVKPGDVITKTNAPRCRICSAPETTFWCRKGCN